MPPRADPRLPALVGPVVVLFALTAAVTLLVWLRPRSLYTLALCTAAITIGLIATLLVTRRRTPWNVTPEAGALQRAVAAALEDGGEDALRSVLRTLGRWPFRLDVISASDRLRLGEAVRRRRLVDELVARASEEEGSARVGAVHLLGWLAPPEAEPALTRLSESRYLTIAEAAAISLLRLGTTSAIATVLGRIGKGPLPDSRIVALLERAHPDQLMPLLAEAAREDDVRCRFWVAHLAGRSNTGASLDVLLELSCDESLDVRANAAESLGLIRDQRGRDRLHALLEDDSWVVRGHAAAALAQLGAVPSVGPLTDLLGDEWWVRERAVRALESAGGAAALALEGLQAPPDSEARRAADDVLRLVERSGPA